VHSFWGVALIHLNQRRKHQIMGILPLRLSQTLLRTFSRKMVVLQAVNGPTSKKRWILTTFFIKKMMIASHLVPQMIVKWFSSEIKIQQKRNKLTYRKPRIEKKTDNNTSKIPQTVKISQLEIGHTNQC
jgi:hypothetical protein